MSAMCDTPDSLQDICLDYIARNHAEICTEHRDLNRNTIKYVFKNSNICCHREVSEKLLEAFQNQLTLNDQLLSLFDASVTKLQRVIIKDASKITAKGLRILRNHKLTDLVITRLYDTTVNELIGCLGDWTLENLQLLNVSTSTFVNNENVRVVVALSKLTNLRCLDVSYTEFNSRGLEIVTEDLPLLESLDISGTMIKDISPLRKCKSKLKYLNMYNLKVSRCSSSLSVLSELQNLQHLDISEDRDEPFDIDHNITVWLTGYFRDATFLPLLVSLDLSGVVNYSMKGLKAFLINHKQMEFLGLMQTDYCHDALFTKPNEFTDSPNLVVSGFATESQIMESLRRYIRRKFFIQRSLYYLYSHIQNLYAVRTDIIKLVLQGMRTYPDVLGIQMAATACLYNLTKGGLSARIHPNYLKKIIDLTLVSMENFPKYQQLQKNTLLTLCSDRMLQDVSFDRYRCAQLVMNSLMAFDDPAMNRMSVAICSILAAKISTVETSNLGAKSAYMKRLLDIIKTKTEQEDIDIMMKFTLSALWNLTDESPRTCQVFLDMGGMNLFLEVLEKFAGESSVETKVLGLMNNIAEVSYLRQYLIKDEFIVILKSLLHSDHIDVSYFAAGIVAHIASEGKEFWNCTSITWKGMLTELSSAVNSWNVPDTEMVAYRSFNPFYPLFSCSKAYEVQLWAAWAVHHVCSKNPERYCSMIADEDGVLFFETLLQNPDLHSSVAKICQEILDIVKNKFRLHSQIHKTSDCKV